MFELFPRGFWLSSSDPVTFHKLVNDIAECVCVRGHVRILQHSLCLEPACT